MAITIGGLATGLDTDSIIEGLLEIQQSRIDKLSVRREEVLQKQSAFKGVEAQLLSLRGSLGQLSGTLNNVFDTKIASVNDETSLSVAADKDAVPGVYSLTVNQLAKANQVATQGFAEADSEITLGDIELQVGDGDAVTVTIDSSNNTLLGLSQAINDSDGDVSARIINDGSGATPYRLLLTSKLTGATNTIAVTNNLAATAGSATQPAFDTGNPVQEATDAEISLGSGAGAITIASATNQIDELIPGVSIDLKAADASKEITVTVTEDIESATTAVQGFVSTYNSVIDYLDSQQAYNDVTDVASPLLGNRTAINLQNELQQTLTTSISGLTTGANRLSTVGITFGDDGRLELNNSKLQAALKGENEDVTLTDLRRLFALDGVSDNNGVEFVSGDNTTQTSPDSGFQVDVTAVDTQATVAGSTVLAASGIVIDSSNNELEIKLDNIESGTLTISEGTYTQAELVDEIQAAIDNAATLSDVAATVSIDSDLLSITSDETGQNSRIAITGGSALTLLGFTGAESDRGADVIGSFIVNGETETATAIGNILVGDDDNEYTANLQVRVTLTPSQVVSGVDATLDVNRGFAARLDEVLGNMLDSVDGDLKAADDSFEAQIEGIDDQIDAANLLFESKQESLIAQFIALESAVSTLQNTGSQLSAQLSSLSGISNSGS